VHGPRTHTDELWDDLEFGLNPYDDEDDYDDPDFDVDDEEDTD